MNELLLFIDDLRKAPEGWHLARTNTQAIELLATGNVVEISLDHDIFIAAPGDSFSMGSVSEETFKPIAYYIALMKDKPKVKFHTGNIEMGRRMAEIIGCHFDYSWPSE